MAGRQSFVRGAVLLSGAVAVTKVLGAVYKIPLANALGAQGMAHFYAAYNVYNVCFLLLISGIPTVLSRQVAHCHALGLYAQEKRTFFSALFLLTLMGLGSGAVLFFFPRTLASALHDAPAAAGIRMLSPSLLCMGAVAALRGYAQGRGEMRSTAISQMAEALVKLIAGLGLTAIFVQRQEPPERCAAAALAGVSLGSVCALWVLLRARHRLPLLSGHDSPTSRRFTVRRLVRSALPVSAGAVGMSLITLLDQTLVLHTLQTRLGYSPQAAAQAYGEYTFSLTLFNLPPGILMTLSVSLMPTVSAALAQKKQAAASAAANTALRLCLLAALPMGVGLSVMSGPLLTLLYPSQPQAVQSAAYHLSVLGLASIFVCLTAVTNGILQAYGREKITFLTLLCGGSVKIISNYLMVSDPAIGIRGACVSTLYCYALIFLLNTMAISRFTSAHPAILSLCWRPLAAVGVMALAVRSSYGVLLRYVAPAVSTLGAVVWGSVVYSILILSLGAVSHKEIYFLFLGRN